MYRCPIYRRYSDTDVSIDFSGVTQEKDVVSIIATEPLTINEHWHSIQPGHYLSRPKHFHIKFTTVDGHTLITQIYFSGDPYIETDPWASEAGNRVIPLIETESGLVGNIDVNLDSETFNTIPGDVNFDGQLDTDSNRLIITSISILFHLAVSFFEHFHLFQTFV